jgi:neutral amino acid transport system ATP-binding protein
MPEATADRDAGAEPILVVDSVVKHYGGVHAVNEASLTVDQGTITGLIGPNGAGKSTLLELISGFQRVDAGRIMFEGRPVQNLPAYAVSRRGIVRTFQAAREWPALTVMENVLLAATPRCGGRFCCDASSLGSRLRHEAALARCCMNSGSTSCATNRPET